MPNGECRMAEARSRGAQSGDVGAAVYLTSLSLAPGEARVMMPVRP